MPKLEIPQPPEWVIEYNELFWCCISMVLNVVSSIMLQLVMFFKVTESARACTYYSSYSSRYSCSSFNILAVPLLVLPLLAVQILAVQGCSGYF